MTSEFTFTKRRFKNREVYTVKSAFGGSGEIENMGNGFRLVFGTLVGSNRYTKEEAASEATRCAREALASIRVI